MLEGEAEPTETERNAPHESVRDRIGDIGHAHRKVPISFSFLKGDARRSEEVTCGLRSPSRVIHTVCHVIQGSGGVFLVGLLHQTNVRFGQNQRAYVLGLEGDLPPVIRNEGAAVPDVVGQGDAVVLGVLGLRLNSPGRNQKK